MDGLSIDVPRPELTNQWWKTFAAIPAPQNPLNPDNEGKIDDIRQPGGVHFLGGAFGVPGSTIEVERDVTVADNQSIVFPILTSDVDNVGYNFSDEKKPSYTNIDHDNVSFKDLPVPYQFSTDDLRIIADAIMDTAEGVSLKVNGDDPLISDSNMDDYRQASRGPYTLDLPKKDDILGYRASYPEKWVKPPYTQGVQDGIWVELKDLPLPDDKPLTINFGGTINFSNIEVKDYNNRGGIGDTPVEAYLDYLKDLNAPPFSLDITYNVDVLPRPEFNALL